MKQVCGIRTRDGTLCQNPVNKTTKKCAAGHLQLPNLSVRDMTPDDLDECLWAGSAEGMSDIQSAIERTKTGEVDYLAILNKAGTIVGSCGIDYLPYPGFGYIWKLIVRPDVRGKGIGTALISAVERRIVTHGLYQARLDVEESETATRHLYYKLGYNDIDRRDVEWYEEQDDGALLLVSHPCIVMTKRLTDY